jgi:hypothetical protein
MKRVMLLAALGAAVAAGVAAVPAFAADLCVGGGGCYATLQSALTAAHDGDTIHVGKGTFAGGVLIDKSVALVGQGANASIVSGGGPVLTIFKESAPTELSVSIRGLTITGGVNDSEPDPEVTFGGGIWIPTSQLQVPPFNGTGATVTIDDSVITGNQVMSRSTIPPFVFCGPLPCGFNSGGGIDNGGVLTITDSKITNNTSGSTATNVTLASGIGSGGIDNRFASTLVLRRSVVSDNHAFATRPNGQFAGAGGIFASGAVTIEDSVVSDNSAEVSGPPAGFGEDLVALGGGIQVSGCCGVARPTAVIRNTKITGNRAVANVGTEGTLAVSFGGGLLVEAPLLMERSQVTDNLARATSGGDAVADGGGMEVDAPMTLRDSLVARNSVVAEAGRAALAHGGGIANADRLTVENTRIVDNDVKASGAGGPLPFGVPSGAIGGGIWNGDFGGPPPTLTVTHSVVAGNSLEAPAGFTLSGGGLFTLYPVSLNQTTVAGNRPDQCFGC